MAKEIDPNAKQLANILDNIGESTASQISLHGGVLVDWAIKTANQYPNNFKQEPDDDNIIYYSHIKEDNPNSEASPAPKL
jgi:hypothetical protein